MTTPEFLMDLEATFNKCLQIAKAKNSDYAGVGDPFKNFRVSEIVGVSPDRAILVRITDKLSRIGNLLEKENIVKDESIQDSILDGINYLAILKSYLECKKND